MRTTAAFAATAILCSASLSLASTLPSQNSFALSGADPAPYTQEWVNTLEQFYNGFSGLHNNVSDPANECVVQVPEFNCTPPEDDDDGIADQDRDAWHLRPKDIRAVIALGDSISAGFAMISSRPPLSNIWEYRGKAFSSGGDPDEHTLANFLAFYTNVTGAPPGVTLPLSHGKDLNDAISGALIQTIPYEASRLAQILRYDRQYRSIRNEWKLVTLLIGANNLCSACLRESDKQRGGISMEDPADPDAFERDLRKTLEVLRNDVGKVFVNLVELFHVTLIYDASRGDAYCEFLFDKSHIYICPCARGDPWQRVYTDNLADEYNRRLRLVADDYRARAYPDFAVVAQPGLTRFRAAEFGQAFLSGIDW
ncbi:hypothetical protein BC937DRAFT_86854 [Endogone sp. FLAS-F59071]|nr:hypothetical protein BC937DRAFT_86854 [Endogone sp. FLAS-F59071]|eukprot:RUS19814.1 hypothetical protein BC937DRAFT_86854 [Endogone sp. FLAS-F59071]